MDILVVQILKKNEQLFENKEMGSTILDGTVTATAQDLFNVNRTINVYQAGSKYYLIDAARPMFSASSAMPDNPEGTIWTIDAFNTSPQKDNFSYDHVVSTNNSWNNKTAISAHYNGGKAYEYFKNIHTRNSINGSGGNIVSLINIADEDGSSMGNAFWNGAAMFYGNGDSNFQPLAKGLDVAGHEMTHGVVQNTANLEYEGESGALNESFADVFGSLIDRDDWLIGEDVVKTNAFPSGALRSLQDPHNGASNGDFNGGWQPRKFSERYTGTQDNGGVHINSGIPNYAYFLFANNASVGKDKAEKVYYKALSSYLTKSSQFVDCRVAVMRAAKELYGDAVANIAASAWDAVEVGGTGGGNYEENAEVNPGTDLILFTTQDHQGLYIYTPDGTEVANPLTSTNPISKPSVSDDGSFIVFVAEDKKIHYIEIDWKAGTAKENIFNISGTNQWRNAVISKDGNRLAAQRSVAENYIVVFDLVSGNKVDYKLSNPTFTSGISTGDVLYADAMEFDITGEYVMYDAFNELKSATSGKIEYWDIGFIQVWNNKSNNFALPDQIEKLFPALDEGISIGNPTFSKNSPFIIAFDYLENNQFAILGSNIERGDIQLIADNEDIGYPSYSRSDNKVIYDYASFGGTDLRITDVKANKIEGVAGSSALYGEEIAWGVWFGNGVRNLSALNEVVKMNDQFVLTPNPVSSSLSLNIKNETLGNEVIYQVIDLSGKHLIAGKVILNNGVGSIDVNSLNQGMYFIQITGKNYQIMTAKFNKI